MTGATLPLPRDVRLTLSIAETKQLWWFLDGAIMNVGTRHKLWASWGLCPQHSWAHAAMEIENRGGRPFSTAILLEDLAARAVRSLRRTERLPWRMTRSQLRGTGECFTCDYQRLERSNHDPMGLQAEQRRASAMVRTRELLTASEDEWRRRSCPSCLGGEGPVCRLHILLEGVEPPRGLLRQTVEDLSRRLHVFNRSMTWHGPQASAAERASWVEGLGWMYGWRYPAEVLSTSPVPAAATRRW